MARIRSVKPSFFMSRAVKKLTDKQKLVWQGLWPNADDEGRLLDEPGILVGLLWALSVTEPKLDQILDDLHRHGRIIRYVVAGERYIQVTNWKEHQKISKPTPSLIPPVPLVEDSGSAPGVGREGSLGEGKGEERKGGGGVQDAEPPTKCPLHQSMDFPPRCPQCGDARRAHEAWLRSQKHRPTIPGILTEADCPKHPGRPARGCDRCAEEEAVS